MATAIYLSVSFRPCTKGVSISPRPSFSEHTHTQERCITWQGINVSKKGAKAPHSWPTPMGVASCNAN
jgi:hypothetical protein